VKLRKHQAFTLIELLIVVAIIGILAAIAVPNFLNAQMKAKLARVQSELKTLSEAYTMYNLDRNSWPPHLDGDPNQHGFVTTPIAYLNSNIQDLFADQRGEKNFFPTMPNLASHIIQESLTPNCTTKPGTSPSI